MQSGCQEFTQTGKRICGRFLQYWLQSGGLTQQGYPISNEFTEKSDLDSREYTVQYFERAVFEMHPENKPPYDVLLSQLGTFQFKRKYPSGEPGLATPTPAPPPGVGVKVPIADQVTATISEARFAPSCGSSTTTIFWNIQLENSGKLPYKVTVDPATFAVTDSTGRTYKLPEPKPDCLVFPGAESWLYYATRQGNVINPGSIFYTGGVYTDATDVPRNARYFDLHVTISGFPLTVRWTP
jgi:hypothetical protein